jgi:hypothetical protein
MSTEPETALRDYLASAGLGLTVATNLFQGPMRPASGAQEAACVYVLQTGGPAPQDELGTGKAIVPYTVQVRVRSATGEYVNGRTLAKAVWAACHQAAITGFFGISVQQAGPMYLGEDEDGRHQFSFYVTMNAHEQF